MDEDDRLIGVKWSSSNENKLISNNKFAVYNSNFLSLTLIEIILGLLCIVGDYYIFDSSVLIGFLNKNIGFSQRLIRALLDNFLHFIVGILSWSIICYPNLELNEVLASGFLASIIDIDHFISAKSFQLVNAISLEKRPFFHNTLTLCVLNISLFCLLIVINPNKKYWSLLFFISWFSHHLRDANRRGIWFGHIFTTEPIKDSLYLGTILILPLFLRYVYYNKLKYLNYIHTLLNFKNYKNKYQYHIV